MPYLSNEKEIKSLIKFFTQHEKRNVKARLNGNMAPYFWKDEKCLQQIARLFQKTYESGINDGKIIRTKRIISALEAFEWKHGANHALSISKEIIKKKFLF